MCKLMTITSVTPHTSHHMPTGLTTHLVCVVLGLCGGEHEEVRLDLSREDLLSGLVVEVDDKWQGLRPDKLCDILLSQLKTIH